MAALLSASPIVSEKCCGNCDSRLWSQYGAYMTQRVFGGRCSLYAALSALTAAAYLDGQLIRGNLSNSSSIIAPHDNRREHVDIGKVIMRQGADDYWQNHVLKCTSSRK